MTDTPGRIMPYDPEYERQLVEMKRKLQTYDTLKEERDELFAGLKYVMEDDNLIPRASSECRKVIGKLIERIES